ncbi:hypothetical protein NPIL_536541 [Nephila pilipes]|uniref:Uncharacterized protein n=1 Tax=Nephila pilipes TaxID=299642 RepID=A0A8X6JXW2_NEPPI|nr:hypothetical protein NPIL_536541 [Nephila pilipes]
MCSNLPTLEVGTCLRESNEKSIIKERLSDESNRLVLHSRIIESNHEDFGHLGLQILINYHRETYRILQKRKIPYDSNRTETTPLSEDRVIGATKFVGTGIDPVGPLHFSYKVRMCPNESTEDHTSIGTLGGRLVKEVI